MPRIRWGGSRLLVAAVVGCLTPLVVVGAVRAAPAPVASAILVDVDTPSVILPSIEESPDIWVAVDTPFTVTLAFVDSTGAPAPLSYTKDVTVRVSADTPLGNVDLGSEVVPPDVTTYSFSRTLTQDIDDAHIHVESVERRGDPVRQGDSGLFDVQSEFSQTDASTALDLAIGGEVNGSECTPTLARKICFEIHIPAGAASGNHVLSLGSCAEVNPCKQDIDYWWSLLDVNAERTNPAITDMGLDKSLKQGVLHNGVPKTKWLVRGSTSEIWVEAPPCAVKGVVGEGQEFCHDVTAGHRDNSGDTWIRLLWIVDPRGSIK